MNSGSVSCSVFILIELLSQYDYGFSKYFLGSKKTNYSR